MRVQGNEKLWVGFMSITKGDRHAKIQECKNHVEPETGRHTHNDWFDRTTMSDEPGLCKKIREKKRKTSPHKQVQMVVNSDMDASGYMPTNEGKQY